MDERRMRERLDSYTREKYGIDPEMLPFPGGNYEIYRHTGSGKWFAVFTVKPRKEFGLDGEGTAAIISVKIRDKLLAELLMRQEGYLSGYPNSRWNWVSMRLDGTVPFEDICRWLDESFLATRTGSNMNSPLPKRDRPRTQKDGEER